MYHDYLGNEVEDQEMDNMRRDAAQREMNVYNEHRRCVIEIVADTNGGPNKGCRLLADIPPSGVVQRYVGIEREPLFIDAERLPCSAWRFSPGQYVVAEARS